MDVVTTPVERVLHLGLYVAGAAVLALAALFVLERVADRDHPPQIRLVHVAIPIVVFLALGAIERLSHVAG